MAEQSERCHPLRAWLNGKSPLKTSPRPGWSWGCVSAIDLNERTIRIADARRDNTKHFVVRADEKLTAFMKPETARGAAGEVKPVYPKNTKWILFNPNQLQKFPQ
jgi:hypothetical protein